MLKMKPPRRWCLILESFQDKCLQVWGWSQSSMLLSSLCLCLLHLPTQRKLHPRQGKSLLLYDIWRQSCLSLGWQSRILYLPDAMSAVVGHVDRGSCCAELHQKCYVFYFKEAKLWLSSMPFSRAEENQSSPGFPVLVYFLSVKSRNMIFCTGWSFACPLEEVSLCLAVEGCAGFAVSTNTTQQEPYAPPEGSALFLSDDC